MKTELVMKYLATFLMATSVVLLSSFTLQSSNIDAVIGALRSGNSSELGKYFDDPLYSQVALTERNVGTGAVMYAGFWAERLLEKTLEYVCARVGIPTLNLEKEIADLKGELQRAYDEKK